MLVSDEIDLVRDDLVGLEALVALEEVGEASPDFFGQQGTVLSACRVVLFLFITHSLSII